MSKFIYVFTDEASRRMEALGFKLIKYDCTSNVWIYENKEDINMSYSDENIQFVLSDTLSF